MKMEIMTKEGERNQKELLMKKEKKYWKCWTMNQRYK